ncbi:SAM-dependent methyltransferase [Streptomyces albospinus]|uniref:SAM-dependent methyltransferase n=1 Tax=Streptomyces albospinus TaxID=285515 RepID=A0ABQ2VHL8_9ACTN|nr:class I SAM-dependent methyltransferase [Streptomyces albospinus]GGU87337.1 SAM-dependent methyltransferase [Streptomyces albospinus]
MVASSAAGAEVPHRRPKTPEELYASPSPWDIGRPQPALQAMAETGEIRGRVLDAGCGTGEHALMAAALGCEVTGVDLATNALEIARRKARNRRPAVRFLRHDARGLATLGETFDTVLDCGLFHVFTGDNRAADVAGLRSIIRSGGRFFMLGFSDAEPAEWQHKLSRDEIIASFADGWRIDSLEPATIDSRTRPAHVRAWCLTLTRL